MNTKQPSSSPRAKSSSASSAASTSSSISSFQLRGHLDSVLCLDNDHATNHDLLLSGSEDKTARLWDLRTSATCTSSNNNSNKPLRASLCIQCPGEVNSVVFGPLQDRESTSAESVPSSPSLFGRDCCVFLAVENSVYGYDLRNAASPVIQWKDDSKKPSTASTSVIVPLSATDEINQIVFSRQKRKQSTQQQPPKSLLAAADDAGEIRVTSQYWMNQTKAVAPPPQRTIILQHSTPGAMITACAFRPNHPCHQSSHQTHVKQRNKKHKKKKQQQQNRQQQDEPLWQQQSQSSAVCTELLATGGTDCTIQLWDVSCNLPQHQQQEDGEEPNDINPQQQPPPQCRRSRPLEQHTMQTLQSGAKQVCNPPMVHSLDWSPSGRILAAGLGDGSVSLFTTIHHHKSSSLLQMAARLEDAHGGAVASVHFPCTNIKHNNRTVPLLGAAAASPDRILLTAGNDGVVVAWDLGVTICEPQPQQQQQQYHQKDNHDHGDVDDDDDKTLSHWMSLLQLGESQSEKSSKSDDDNNKKGNDDDYDYFDCDQPKTLFGIPHGIKPNWMVTNYNCSSSSGPCTIFVADTSNDITAYTIPS